ncbi:hypothetical protein [Actinoplanes nipponensis]|uniref:hypothetical protein n=1 Tax=Actinoplanes nipponensis TaxID=135950 RepID=UPI001940B5CE|nr:hypothetical protein [Actinoplanes nipponensis]
MTEDGVAYERRSAVPVIIPVRPRKLAEVPFVELAEGRLQGVVSSRSDPRRLYASSITARRHGLSCHTNNNRPCGSLGGGQPCKHIGALIDAAVARYGLARVAHHLEADLPEDGADLGSGLRPGTAPDRAAEVFSSFLRHLAHLDLPPSTEPLPELQWFPAAAAVR